MPVRTSVLVALGVGAATVQAWRWRRRERARHMRNDDIRHAIQQNGTTTDARPPPRGVNGGANGGDAPPAPPLTTGKSAAASASSSTTSAFDASASESLVARFVATARAEAAADEPPQYVEADKLIPGWDWNWDGRAHASRSTATRHIFLARHGRYVMDAESHLQVLDMLGVVQALLLAERVAALTETGIAWERLISSDMPRAAQTAAIVHRQVPIVPWTVDPQLREGRPCVPTPLTASEQKRWDRYAHRIAKDDGPRIAEAFERYFYRAGADQTSDSYTLIVCHANVIRYFVCRALQLPPEAWLRFSLAHCSLTHLRIRPDGRVSLATFGDVGHLGSHWPAAVTTS